MIIKSNKKRRDSPLSLLNRFGTGTALLRVEKNDNAECLFANASESVKSLMRGLVVGLVGLEHARRAWFRVE
jgi:hypothetical protein